MDGLKEKTVSSNYGTTYYWTNEIKAPYFYSVFILNGTNVAFNELKVEDLQKTYSYIALHKSLKSIKK